jgi:[ribosomal protein S5]-alanine N-acetyltransferase
MDAVAIETDRLRLVPLQVGDLDKLVDLHADPEVMRSSRGVGEGLTRGESAEWLEHTLSTREKPWHQTFRVENRADHCFIGRCGLRPDEASDQTELAFSFVRRAWGKGYATEAVQALVEWGVGKGLVRLVACVLDHNVGSQRVLDKIGLKRVGQRSTDQGNLMLYESDVLSPPREIRVVGG